MALDLQPIRDRLVDEPCEVDLRDAYLVGRPEEADRCRIVALTRAGDDLLDNAADDINALLAEVEQLRALIGELTDPEPCDWDHNHSCQAHGYFFLDQGRSCPMYDAQQVVRALKDASV